MIHKETHAHCEVGQYEFLRDMQFITLQLHIKCNALRLLVYFNFKMCLKDRKI